MPAAIPRARRWPADGSGGTSSEQRLLCRGGCHPAQALALPGRFNDHPHRKAREARPGTPPWRGSGGQSCPTRPSPRQTPTPRRDRFQQARTAPLTRACYRDTGALRAGELLPDPKPGRDAPFVARLREASAGAAVGTHKPLRWRPRPRASERRRSAHWGDAPEKEGSMNGERGGTVQGITVCGSG